MEATSFLAQWGFVESELREDIRIDVGTDGTIVALGHRDAPLTTPRAATIRSFGPALVVPGFVNAHSHAFQRGIRGLTQQRGQGDPSNFWSWREAMYTAALRLTPEDLYDITKLAFDEMLRAGITRVGEFHYVHHQPGGTPYDDPNELSWQVVRAAEATGIRLTLLDVFYARAGAGQPALPEQRRFCDPSVDAYLARIDALRRAGVAVGITPHSVRAVGRTELAAITQYAAEHDLPVHTHLSEQPLENEQCGAEHGCSPAELFDAVGALDRTRAFTAVHAVHVSNEDVGLLSRQSVCACPTTEADLGDGIVAAGRLVSAGTNIALGSDSNAVIDPVQEARLLEMGDRLGTQQRLRMCGPGESLGAPLLRAATHGGAISLGTEDGVLKSGAAFDAAVFDLTHHFFAALPLSHCLDALMASGTAAPLRQVIVGGVEKL